MAGSLTSLDLSFPFTAEPRAPGGALARPRGDRLCRSAGCRPRSRAARVLERPRQAPLARDGGSDTRHALLAGASEGRYYSIHPSVALTCTDAPCVPQVATLLSRRLRRLLASRRRQTPAAEDDGCGDAIGVGSPRRRSSVAMSKEPLVDCLRELDELYRVSAPFAQSRASGTGSRPANFLTS